MYKLRNYLSGRCNVWVFTTWGTISQFFPKPGIINQIVYNLLYACIINASLTQSAVVLLRKNMLFLSLSLKGKIFAVCGNLWVSAAGSTWSGMRGCSSSMSIKTSPEIEWGSSPTQTHSRETHWIHTSFYMASLVTLGRIRFQSCPSSPTACSSSGVQRYSSRDWTVHCPTMGFLPNWRLSMILMTIGGM